MQALCACGCGEPVTSPRNRYLQHHHLRKHGRYAGASQRDIHLIRTYGITPDDYGAMLAAQSGRCAICHQEQNGRPLSVDHNHQTEAVRGLLCVRCNSCLGWFEKFGVRAVGYLERHAPAA